MFGHGSSRCKVKTFCANCAGSHKTSECKDTTIRCANCNGSHKSTFDQCPSKVNYLSMRQRSQPVQQRRPRNYYVSHPNSNYNSNFPNTLHQSANSAPSIWISQNNGNSNSNQSSNTNDLFTIQEMKNITLELITNLKNCKSKIEQFEVVTSLAIKFLT